MRQSEEFLRKEGDAWFERNREKLGEADPVTDAIAHIGIAPKAVLEIGCCNGWRLEKLRETYGCSVIGVEPSLEASVAAASRRVPVHQASADDLPMRFSTFDVVIYGFCLYLTDPEDWFRIAMEGDRVLKDGGWLIIHDFEHDGRDFAREYAHRAGILSYHINWSRIWHSHPWYQRVYGRSGTNGDYVTVMNKNTIIPVLP